MSGDLLSTIQGPEDVKALSEAQLPQLAQEIRDFLIETLAPIGGHLGASLGVVELSVALHYVFSSPQDKIVWDVSHQAYPHKMLTGRLSQMSTIRQYGGLSGFTKRSESEHDVFGAGHASTSISAAYGLAIARDIKEEDGDVIAVIGDGALTGGMALEALNHAGARQNRLLIILNDNEMSIAPNVGALSAYLSRVISGKSYTTAKDAAKKVLEVLPGALDAARRLEEHVKGMITPGTLFEELGLRYLGPIDGNDFEHLLPVLHNCQQLTGPIILHVLTRKGLGYSPAEEDPETWHGLGPYDQAAGKPIPSACVTPSYTSVFSDCLCEHARLDERIVAITAAMPAGTGLDRFANLFPDRFFDVGIAEQHAVTFAAGLAAAGMRPVVAIYSTFMQRAYDQIVHDVCIQKLPVIFCMDRAGVVGADGATHTGLLDIAFMRSLPSMVCMAPADERELGDMLLTALRLNAPCAIRYPRGEGVGVPQRACSVLPLGKAALVMQGDDGLVISVGTRLQAAEAALRTLAKLHNQHFTLMNLRFIKPIDEEAIVAALINGRPLVVIEEGVAQGGVGESIATLALKSGWQGRFLHLNMTDDFPAHGTQQQILHDLGLDEAGVYRSICGVLEVEPNG